MIIEPSAGDGSFSNQLPKDKLLALDIDPKKDNIKQQDFLEFNYKGIDRAKVLCIGNPPFGKICSLALKFIKKCTEFSDTIAFILPRSFKKPSIQSKIPENYHLIKEIILDNCFTWKDKDYYVPAVFQIWGYKEEKRKQIEKMEPLGFEYVKKENADLSVRRVGFYAGKAYKDIQKSVESHYFIKLKNIKIINNLIDYLEKYKWEENNTTGPRSISKQELNLAINSFNN